MAQNLNLATFHVGIDSAIRTSTNNAFNLHAKLVTNVFSNSKRICTIRVTHHLHVALAVTQINKNHTAMVASTVNPTAQADSLT